MSLLFEPLSLRGLTTANRVWLAPMCQYSVTARDGVPTDWHLVHLGSHAIGGFGLILTEATAVVPEGRISPEDTGLWNDEQTVAWRRIVDFVHGQGTPIGVQLAHAGRKASTYGLFPAGEGSVPTSADGWQAVSSTATAYPTYDAPRAMTTEEVRALPAAFAAAAGRADAAGFDTVEIHGAHGYLVHQFLSPLVNDRTDEYGGSFENRTRLLVEIVDAVRAAWPDDKPLLVRLSATDWAPDGLQGWDVEQSARLCKELAGHGVDLVDVSSAGAIAEQEITVGPGYQVPFAAEVRRVSGLPTGAVGLITEPAQAEEVLADGSADVVLLARAALREPAWPLRAAAELGVHRDDAGYAPQYLRGAWPRTT
jgi:2,4-dienoyl-CoA reductase-like NADH-dependent reductase (Old Yellow Enzyme family)